MHSFFVKNQSQESCNTRDSIEFSRSYKKGKSFNCTEFVKGETYYNNDFVQDFVIHEGCLYACVRETRDVPNASDDWKLVVRSADLVDATASVDNKVGTPKVVVTTTAEGLDKKFHFDFFNLKGERGLQGIQGEKGEQGERGPQGEPGTSSTHNIGSIDLFEQIIAQQQKYDLTQEDKEAILNGKVITTSVGNGTVPTISINSIEGLGLMLIFHFNERLYSMCVMWNNDRCYINGFFSFSVHTRLFADSELSETSENAVQNKVVYSELQKKQDTISDLAGIIASIEQQITGVNSSLSAELAKKPNKTDIATINGQSLINGGNIKIEGGGTGDGAELVEFIYLFGQELSEEQKATNAASYAKMASRGNYIPYVKTSEGINVSVSLWGIKDGVLLLPIESEVLPLLGMSKILICIDATGQIQVEPLLIDTHVLFEEDFVSYDTLREKAVAIVGENGINLSPIRVIGSTTGDLGWTDEIIVQGDYVILIYTTDYGVKYQIMGYGGDQKGIIKEIIAGGIIYLNVTDPTSQEAMNNKMANLFYGMPHTFKIKVVNEDTDWYYTPLMIKAGAVVIFRNDTIEAWLLNSDGTTTLSDRIDGIGEGAVGPQGPEGPQGPQGEKGDKGDKGDCNFEVGTTEPTQSGTSNDIYLDIETGTFYRFNKS